MTSASNNARQAKILMAAGRIKRQIDRAKISCPPLSTLASPKPEEIAELKALLNQCMSIGGELGEEAENLWDLLELTGANEAQSQSTAPAAPSPTANAQANLARQAEAAASAKRKAELEAKQKAELAAKAQKDAPKKKGLFGWLAPEKPEDSDGDDGDDGDDGHYKGGLR